MFLAKNNPDKRRNQNNTDAKCDFENYCVDDNQELHDQPSRKKTTITIRKVQQNLTRKKTPKE